MSTFDEGYSRAVENTGSEGPRARSSKRRKKLRADVATFMRQYGRTSKRGGYDPNDRKYDRSVEQLVKSLPPDELDRILRDDEDDPD